MGHCKKGKNVMVFRVNIENHSEVSKQDSRDSGFGKDGGKRKAERRLLRSTGRERCRGWFGGS